MGEELNTPLTASNRRNDLRVSCSVPVLCELNGETFEGLLKDVSPHGLRLELKRRLMRNQVLRISRPSIPLAPVLASVRWCRRHAYRDILLAGLELNMSPADLESTWVQPVLATFDFLHPVAIELIPEPSLLQTTDVTEIDAPETQPVVVQLVAEAEESISTALTVPEVFHMEHNLPPQDWTQLLMQAQDLLSQESRPLLSKIIKGFKEFAFEDRASVEERRRVARLTCLYQISLVDYQAVEVLDLSPAGLGLLSNQKIARGKLLKVMPPTAFNDFAALMGCVRYCCALRNRFRIGIEFKDPILPSWVNPALRQLGFAANHLEQKRRYVRAKATLPIEVRDWRGEFELATMLDLSRGGTLLHTERSWEVGEILRLVLGPVGYLPVLFLSGVVLNQRPDVQGWLVNLSFVQTDSANLSRLDLYIKNILTHSRR